MHTRARSPRPVLPVLPVRPRSTGLVPVVALALALLLVLTACGGADADADAAAPSADADASGSAVGAEDLWVRAADGGMTAVFGTLTNAGDEDRVLVAATTPVAGAVELHEVVESGGTSVMQERPEGFVVPAAGSHELAPGADHLMLMDLAGPVAVGEQVTLELTFDDGTTLTVEAVVKEAPAGDETYHGDHGEGHDR